MKVIRSGLAYLVLSLWLQTRELFSFVCMEKYCDDGEYLELLVLTCESYFCRTEDKNFIEKVKMFIF